MVFFKQTVQDLPALAPIHSLERTEVALHLNTNIPGNEDQKPDL